MWLNNTGEKYKKSLFLSILYNIYSTWNIMIDMNDHLFPCLCLYIWVYIYHIYPGFQSLLYCLYLLIYLSIIIYLSNLIIYQLSVYQSPIIFDTGCWRGSFFGTLRFLMNLKYDNKSILCISFDAQHQRHTFRT